MARASWAASRREKGGQTHLGRPVFNTVKDAVRATGAEASLAFVPPPYAADALMEAADAGLRLVCIITDGIPAQDMMRVKRYLRRYPKDKRTTIVGPNCAGIISAGKAMLGIMPSNIYIRGNVGVVSRSGTLGYEAGAQMKALGIGVTTSVGIGGDPINGSSFLDHLMLFEQDPETKAVIMIGEIGGPQEAEAAKWVKENMSKPVVGYVAGLTAPKGRRMGHAGAIISAEGDSAAEKARNHEVVRPIRCTERGRTRFDGGAGVSQGGLKRAAARAARNLSRAVLLFDLLVGVVQRHEPQVAEVLREERTTAGMPASLLARTLQAQGIWFQLLAIAEQNRDMRNRREAERERGHEQLRGTFANVFAAAAAEGITAAEIRKALSGLRVRPVITAHPTEAKRVTVLERHRRIYLRLLELESPRWTDRERQELIQAAADEIELLWLTGELKLAKPTVAQEVAWGLYFFNENLFDVVPQLFAKVDAAFAKQFPDEPFEAPLFFQFGSWIGGDRDGNPYVTSEVTRRTLWDTRLASLHRYRSRLLELVRNLSIEDHALALPDSFREAVAQAIRATPDGEVRAARNRGEIFRQFLSCMLSRIEITIAHAEREQPAAGELRLRQRRPLDGRHRPDARCTHRRRCRASLRCPAAAVAPRSRRLSLQHGAAGHSRKQHAHQRRPSASCFV